MTRDNADLTKEALFVVYEYCDKYPSRDEQKKAQEPINKIADPSWKIVGREKGYSDGTRFLIDENNIEIDGFDRNIWIKSLSKEQTIEGKTYQNERVNVNCSSGTITVLSSVKYVNGERLDEQTGPFSIQTITPGTSGADLYNYVCRQ